MILKTLRTQGNGIRAYSCIIEAFGSLVPFLTFVYGCALLVMYDTNIYTFWSPTLELYPPE